MIAAVTRIAVAASALMAVTACDQIAANRDAAEKDRPNLVAGAEPEKGDTAVIDATPQASLSAEERQQLRELASGYIDDAATQLAQGYSAVTGMEDEIVALQPTQTHEYAVRLSRGTTYRIIGGCDNECSDFDLELLNQSGQVVERDTLPDDVPVINITPPADGQYRVRMTMKTCTIAPCYAAARVYHRTGAAPRAGGTTT